MLRIIIILIGLLAWNSAFGWDCPGKGELIVTAPRAGAHTFNDSIAVRGFLCEDYQLVVVRNRTTETSVLTNTDEVCEGGICVYTFAAFMDDLALGVNDLEATVPGIDPPMEATVQVIRTALAAK